MRYIESYLHHNEIGVLIELETPDEITLRCQEFKDLAMDLALQIVATDPLGIDSRDMRNVIPARFRQEESPVANEALLDQAWIKDPSITVREMLQKVEEVLKTPIRIRRFTRYATNET